MQLTSPSTAKPRQAANVPATVTAFDNDGGARVILLAAHGSLKAGVEVRAFLRPDRFAKKPVDFQRLNKKGLRIGGTVMLHRVLQEARDCVSAYRIETLKRRPDDVQTRVMTGVLGCVLPPMDDETVMVEQAILCLLPEAIPVRTISSRLEDLAIAIEDASLFGTPGIVFRGEERGGTMMGYPYRPPEVPSATDLIRDFLSACPKSAFKYARSASDERLWELVPMVMVQVDPDRRSRLSAQAANVQYIQDGELRFAESTATLSITGGSWFLMDLTPTRISPTMVGFDWPRNFTEKPLSKSEAYRAKEPDETPPSPRM